MQKGGDRRCVVSSFFYYQKRQGRIRVQMNIGELVKKFVGLASKPVLTKADHTEVRQLMRQLKKEGMSNEEISELSKGKWTPSTIKFYTPGIKSSHPSPWQSAVALLDNLMSTNMTLDDVDTAVTVFEDLKSHGISLDQVIDFLLAADSYTVDLNTIVQQHQALKEFSLSPEDIAKMLALKKEFEAEGMSVDSLPMLVELASSYGDTQKVLEAVSAYGSLEQLKAEIKATKEELNSFNEQTASLGRKLEQTQATLSELTKPLQAYHNVLELGFGEKQLDDLATLAEKYGGPKAVFQVLKGYNDYAEIKNKVSKAKSELGNLESEINKLSTKHSHLATAINMCLTLINQYKFGLDAIATTLSLAAKYGEPLVVLKCVEAYGELQTVQQALTKLEGKVAERKELLVQLEGRYHEALSQMESLNAMALKLGAEVSKVENRLADSKGLEKIINLINNPASAGYNEYGPLVLAITVALNKWVVSNDDRFKFPYSIKKGLEELIAELAGS